MSTRVDFAKLTLMDALDLASLIELEAVGRYAMFAEQLGHARPTDAGSVFHTMVHNEQKHCDQLSARRKALFGAEPMRVTLDDLFDVEAPEVGAPRLNMSRLKALNLALNSEQKAFNFYNQALRFIENEEVKTLFKELRDEESEHINMVTRLIEALPAGAGVDQEDLDEDQD